MAVSRDDPLVSVVGSVSSGIRTPGPAESEQTRTGPSCVIELGTRPEARAAPLIVAFGAVNSVSTSDWLVNSAPDSICASQVSETHKTACFDWIK